MQKRLGALGAALLGSFVIVACVAAFTANGGTPSPSKSPGPTKTTSSPASPTATPQTSPPSTPPQENGYVASLVPGNIKGPIDVAVATGSSSLDDDLVIDLGDLMGMKWVPVKVSQAPGDNTANDTVIADVQQGTYKIAISDLSEQADNREAKVDFLTYLANAQGAGPQGIAFNKKYGLEDATRAALAILVGDGELQTLLAKGPAQATPISATDSFSIIRH